MSFLADQLSGVRAGRVLDIATGDGEFLDELLEIIESYREAIGIDTAENRLEQARKQVQRSGVSFQTMDAYALAFEDSSFDLVSVRNALHHVNEPSRLLQEMFRVLVPGGYFVVVEQVRDGLDRHESMHRELHHWWGAVHRAQGKVHNETLTTDQLHALIDNLGMSSSVSGIVRHAERDPFDPERLAALDETINEHIAELEKIESLANRTELIAEGRELQKRIPEIGVAWAKHVGIVARK